MSEPVAVVLGLLGVVVLIAVVVLPTMAFYWHRFARVAEAAGPGSFVIACVDPQDPRAWRALVIDGDGVHLRSTLYRRETSWSWPTIAGASAGTVEAVVATIISHYGVRLRLTDGSTVGFLFPSRSTLRYPPALVDQVLQEFARWGKSPAPAPSPHPATSGA